MRFLRYVLVQGAAYGIDMGGFFLLLTFLAMAPLMANIISKIMAGLFAFAVHRSFTFEVVHDGRKMQQAAKYFTLLGLNIPLSSTTLALALWIIPIPVAAKLTADLAGVIITYWLSKRFVFLVGQHEADLTNSRAEK